MLRCGLASDGVYICPSCYQEGGSLLHCPSTLTASNAAVHFCCTVLGVASTGCYPASLPCEARTFLVWQPFGLPAATIYPTYLFCKPHFITILRICKSFCFLQIETSASDKLTDQRIIRNRITWNRQEIIEKFQKPFRLFVFRLIRVRSRTAAVPHTASAPPVHRSAPN